MVFLRGVIKFFKFVRNLFIKLMKFLFSKPIHRAYSITMIIAITIVVLGMVLENTNCFPNDNNLSHYMADCFEAHTNKEFSAGYVIYYSLLYFVIIPLYIGVPLYFLAKKNEINWCSYVIFVSVVFLFFINAYLTEMLQYKDNGDADTIYQMHMASFICVSTAIIGAAGIKLAAILNKDNKLTP